MTTMCDCEQAGTRFDQFEARSVGCDESSGRFAEVEVWRCLACGRDWLRYSMEHEAFSRSGRWTRGLITGSQAAAVTAESAVAVLSGLPWRLEGGSYYDGVVTRRAGPLAWS